jgi:hypothetical protein
MLPAHQARSKQYTPGALLRASPMYQIFTTNYSESSDFTLSKSLSKVRLATDFLLLVYLD